MTKKIRIYNYIIKKIKRLSKIIVHNEKELKETEKKEKLLKLEIEIPDDLFAKIECIAKIKNKTPMELIKCEINQIFHAYLEDCKHLLG